MGRVCQFKVFLRSVNRIKWSGEMAGKGRETQRQGEPLTELLREDVSAVSGCVSS